MVLKRRYGILVVLSSLGYLLGFGTQMLIAYHFGTSSALDAYWLALAIVGAMSFFVHPLREALVPVVFRAAQSDIERASMALTAGLLLLLALSLVAVALIATNFLGVGGLIGAGNSAVSQAQLILPALIPYLILYALAETSNALLISFDLVILQSVARLLSAIGAALAIYFFGASVGVQVLIISLLLGQGVMLLTSWRALRDRGLRLRWGGFGLLGEASFLTMFGALLLNYVLAQIYVLYERWVMAEMMVGAVSSFQYASMLVNVVLSIVAYSLINLLWPRLMAQDGTGDQQGMLRLLVRVGAPLCFLLLICAIFVFRYAHFLVDILFSRGAFAADSLTMTGDALQMTAFATVSVGMVALAVRALMSRSMGRAVMIVGVSMTLAGSVIITSGYWLGSLRVVQAHWVISNAVGLLVASLFLLDGVAWHWLDVRKLVWWFSRALMAACLPLFGLQDFYFGNSIADKILSISADGATYLAMVVLLAWILQVIDFSWLWNQRSPIVTEEK